MKHQYAPKNRNARLAHLQCELCECGHAIAKVNRWGAHSRNPEKPDDPLENPVNIAEVLFELWDVEAAATALMPDIVSFLGVELVANMRAHWEAKALPPVVTDQIEDEPELRRKCMVCSGLGRIRSGDVGMTVVEKCSTCDGTGLVAVESPGEEEKK